jgi:methylmalonyl-CoA mutase C-terminal domain/subunit
VTERIRVVVAELTGDGHDRGAEVVARALRDAGMEVIYTGRRQSPDQIVATALQEDADLIGLSVRAGTHLELFSAVLKLLAEREAEDVVVFGGTVPESEVAELRQVGVAKVFTSGATVAEIVAWVRNNVPSIGSAQT